MKAIQDQLDGLQQWLGSTVGAVLDTALAIESPNGHSSGWLGLLQSFNVNPMPEEERVKTASISPTTRGAPVQEVYEVAGTIARRGNDALEKINQMIMDLDFDDPDEDAHERQYSRLRGLCDRLQKDSVAKYRSVVMPRRSMFAAAKAAAAQQKTPVGKVPSSGFVLKCRNCGAPRLDDKGFACDFCGARLG